MQDFYKIPETVGLGTPIIAANSTQVSVGDPLTIDADGNLIVATAGAKVIGFSKEDITVEADNETVDKYCPQYVPARPGVQMKYNSDQACTQTDIGAYANLTGTTGAIKVDLAATTTGQFVVLAFDPEVDGDTDVVIVEVAEPQYLGFTQD